jgi:MFS family permease
VKSFLTEITDESNRGTGFSYMSSAWSIGTIIAPLIGGLLSQPSKTYPKYFSSHGIFGIYPYFLPCLICAGFSVISTIMCSLSMEETRKFSSHKSHSSNNSWPKSPISDTTAIESPLSPDSYTKTPTSTSNKNQSNSKSSMFSSSFSSSKELKVTKYMPISSNDIELDDFNKTPEGDELDDEKPSNFLKNKNFINLANESKEECNPSEIELPRISPSFEKEISFRLQRINSGTEDVTDVETPVGHKEPVYEYLQEDDCQCDCFHRWCDRSLCDGSPGDDENVVEGTEKEMPSDAEFGLSYASPDWAAPPSLFQRLKRIVLGRFSGDPPSWNEVEYAEVSEDGEGSSPGTRIRINRKHGINRKNLSSSSPMRSSKEVHGGTKALAVLRQKPVLLTTGTYGLLAMGFMLLDETLPLFLRLDASDGGLSFAASDIGSLLSLSGIAVLFFALFVLPRLCDNSSKAILYRVSILLAAPVILAWPAYALFRVRVLQPVCPVNLLRIITWVFLTLIGVARGFVGCVAFTAVMIQTNHSVYDEHLGLVNGLGQSLASFSRALGPALGGLLWSVSIFTHFIFLNFIVVVIILLISLYTSSLMPAWLEKKRQPIYI